MRERGRGNRTYVLLILKVCINNLSGTDGFRSLSPTLTLFLAPHGKLYLRLQGRVPESDSVRLVASTLPKTMASSIEIPDALLQATDFASGYPK